MNKLELCKAVLLGSGQTGSMLTTVGQKGILARISNWVDQAYLDIQRMGVDWKWMLSRDFTANISQDKTEYTPTEMLLTNLKRYDTDSFFLYDPDDGVDSGGPVIFIKDFDLFRSRFMRGARPSGSPKYIASPNGSTIITSHNPDQSYVLLFDYWKSPQRLTTDADVPEMPPQYHDMIVDKALIKYAAFDDAPEVKELALENFKSMYRDLYREQAFIVHKKIKMRPLT